MFLTHKNVWNCIASTTDWATSRLKTCWVLSSIVLLFDFMKTSERGSTTRYFYSLCTRRRGLAVSSTGFSQSSTNQLKPKHSRRYRSVVSPAVQLLCRMRSTTFLWMLSSLQGWSRRERNCTKLMKLWDPCCGCTVKRFKFTSEWFIDPSRLPYNITKDSVWEKYTTNLWQFSRNITPCMLSMDCCWFILLSGYELMGKLPAPSRPCRQP